MGSNSIVLSTLRQAREAAGITREQAAVAVGVSTATLRMWEAETPKQARVLAGLARLYGCSIDALVHEAESATPATAGVEIGDGPAPAKKRAAASTQGA